jgi:hypothetical protein
MIDNGNWSDIRWQSAERVAVLYIILGACGGFGHEYGRRTEMTEPSTKTNIIEPADSSSQSRIRISSLRDSPVLSPGDQQFRTSLLDKMASLHLSSQRLPPHLRALLFSSLPHFPPHPQSGISKSDDDRSWSDICANASGTLVLVLRWVNVEKIEHERHGRAIYLQTLFVHAKTAEHSHQSRIQVPSLVETHYPPTIPHFPPQHLSPNILASLLHFSLHPQSSTEVTSNVVLCK